MNDIKKIRFKQIDDGLIQIIAVFDNGVLGVKENVVGEIFSEQGELKSFSGKNSIQICGFDHMEGLWSCGRFNHAQDCCLVWNDIENWLKKKSGDSKSSSFPNREHDEPSDEEQIKKEIDKDYD